MAEIRLLNVTKTFGNFKAVEEVCLEICDGEMVCLLGPSGCGKTTTLRLIAGFERPDAGEIYIKGRLVSSPKSMVPPEHRNLGMVFQNYAVWPHMTVFDNVAYPLKLKKLPRSEIQAKVKEVLEMVGLGGLEKRYPEQLSGGQQQRVALARALVVKPDALLLDEPLSNLDAKLRERMRFEIMELQRRLRITLVYVTHDQAEAMVLSDRMVIMNQGKIVQIGSPLEVYQYPVNPFVADFLGLANFIPATLVEQTEGEGLAELGLSGYPKIRCRLAKGAAEDSLPISGVICTRPESIQLLPAHQGHIEGKVLRVTFLGPRLDVRVKVDDIEVRVELPLGARISEGDSVSLKIEQATFFRKEVNDHVTKNR
ncbi:MAG: ABC transporter ATP-binding protein [Candidatus Bathyarchaeia archaeon]